MESSESKEKKKKLRRPARQARGLTHPTQPKKPPGRPRRQPKPQPDHLRDIAPRPPTAGGPHNSHTRENGQPGPLSASSASSATSTHHQALSAAPPTSTPIQGDTMSPNTAEEELSEPDIYGRFSTQGPAYGDLAGQVAQDDQPLFEMAASDPSFSMTNQMIGEALGDEVNHPPGASPETWLWRPELLDPRVCESCEADMLDAAMVSRRLRNVLRSSMSGLGHAAGFISQRLAEQELGFRPYPNWNGRIRVWVSFLSRFVETESHIETRVDLGPGGTAEVVKLYVVPMQVDVLVLDRPAPVITYVSVPSGNDWRGYGENPGDAFLAGPATATNTDGTGRPPHQGWPALDPTLAGSTTAPPGWWVPASGLLSLGAPAAPVDSGPKYFAQPTANSGLSALDGWTPLLTDTDNFMPEQYQWLPGAGDAGAGDLPGDVPNDFFDFD